MATAHRALQGRLRSVLAIILRPPLVHQKQGKQASTSRSLAIRPHSHNNTLFPLTMRWRRGCKPSLPSSWGLLSYAKNRASRPESPTLRPYKHSHTRAHPFNSPRVGAEAVVRPCHHPGASSHMPKTVPTGSSHPHSGLTQSHTGTPFQLTTRWHRGCEPSLPLS